MMLELAIGVAVVLAVLALAWLVMLAVVMNRGRRP
jgi:hypothetical protein